jgi:hypothetical protein
VFSEGVQHRLWFCLDHLICVKMVAFQFYLQLGNQKSRSRNVRWCVVVMQQPVLLLPKFRAKSLYIFTVKHHSSMRNWLFGQDEFFVNNPLDAQQKWWACSWPCFSTVSLFFFFFFFVSVKLLCASCFLHERLCNHCPGLCCTFSKICTKFNAVPLSDPSRNRIRADMWLHIKEYKKIAFTELLEMLYTVSQDMLVLCIALVQLLYRWQHQSRILWILPRICFDNFFLI